MKKTTKITHAALTHYDALSFVRFEHNFRNIFYIRYLIVSFSNKKRSQNWRRKHIFSWLSHFNILALWASDYSNRRKRFSFLTHSTLRRENYLIPNSNIITSTDPQFREVVENLPTSPLIKFLKHKKFWPILANLHFKSSVCTILLTPNPWVVLPLNINNNFRLHFYRTFAYSGQGKTDLHAASLKFAPFLLKLLLFWVKEVYKTLLKLTLPKLFVYACLPLNIL